MRTLAITLAFAAPAAAIHAPNLDRRRALAKWRRVERQARTPTTTLAFVAPKTPNAKGKPLEPKPGGLLQFAYNVCGLATTAAWTAIVLTTISSNQPFGMLMPTMQRKLK